MLNLFQHPGQSRPAGGRLDPVARPETPRRRPLMTSFYVSWMKPQGRARIHKGECSNCNHGAGQKGQSKPKQEVTGWHGPMTFEAAEQKLAELRRQGYGDTDKCGTCLRSARQ
jgi:hypothetical protein